MNLFQRSIRFCFKLLICLFFTSSYAQEGWDLKKCIDYALENNLQVKQAELNTELSEVNLWQTRANILPSVNGNASHAYNFGRTIDPFTNQFATDLVRSNNFSLSSNFTLFNGFQNLNNVQQGQMEYLASRYETDKMKNDISLSIATAYLQILFSEELLLIARNQVNITAQQVERTSKLVNAGSLARGSLLEIEAQLTTEELQAVNAQNQVDMAYLSLKQLLDFPPDDTFSIIRPVLEFSGGDILAATPEIVYINALKVMPEIKSAEFRLKGAEKGIAVARGSLSPRIFVNGALGTGYSGLRQQLVSVGNDGFQTVGYTASGEEVVAPVLTPVFEPIPFMDQVNENFNKSVGFFMTIPIFNGWQSRTAISRAKIARYNAEYNLETAQLQLNKTISQAYADAMAAFKKFAATEKSLEALKESFKYAEQRFNVGMLNALEYNNAKNRLMNAESELLQAKYDYIFKLKVLDFYQGRPLELK